jgi:DNA end-binding protein Ku
MPRALWKGAISFGLVNIPVRLYSAEDRKEMSFSMLDRRDMSPVGYHRVNKETGKEVPWKEIAKGYEYKKGKYVVLTDEDFRRANVKATQTVDIVAFVDAHDIPAVYYDTPYYLAPEKRGEKAYALLREALRKAGKAGLATVVVRKRQHLAVVMPLEDILVLDTLRYHDELRPWSELGVPGKATRPNEKEVNMALRLIEEMSDEWKPENYEDTYRHDILARVKQKVKAGQTEELTEPQADEKPEKGADIIDLMSLLKRSVEGGGKGAKPSNGSAGHRRAGAGRARPAKRAVPARAHRERRRHA